MKKSEPTKNSNPRDLASTIGLDEINDLLQNKRKLFWLNVQTGLTRGFAGVVGAAIAVVLIGFLVARLAGVPFIGDFLHDLGSATRSTQTK